MTKEEAIKHLGFMAKGYQNLLDNDERCLEAVGKGYKGEVEAQESLADVYKAQIDALNLAIKALEQEPKTGHWIYELEDWNKWTCSECGWSKRTDVHVKLGYSYCPNCGADMRGEADKGVEE